MSRQDGVHERIALKQDLFGWQVFFIVISAVIGSGIFENDAAALHESGPIGFIVATAIVGVIAICVMESVSELVQLFPCPNAIVEYTRAFVDRDLAWVVGIAYWYTYVATFAAQNLALAQLCERWIQSKVLEGLVFFTLTPLVLLDLNLAGVFWYGVVETIGGILKLLLVIGGSIAMYVLSTNVKSDSNADGGSFRNDTRPIEDGFQDRSEAPHPWQAVCYSIPLVFFSFLGLEAVTVTAIEVRNVNTSRWPSRYVAYVVFVCYMLCVVSYSLDISWQNANLQTYGEIATNTTASQGRPSWVGTTLGSSYSPLVLISMASNQPGLAGFFQGACVFSVVSAANTSLYLASRTFYGLCLDLPDSPGFLRGLKHICTSVRRSTSAPLAALLFCVITFFWLPFLHFRHTSTVNTSQVITAIAVSASISCVFVWAVLCVAFIRYQMWLHICDSLLTEEKQTLKRRFRGSPKPATPAWWSWHREPSASTIALTSFQKGGQTPHEPDAARRESSSSSSDAAVYERYGASTLFGTTRFGQPLMACIGLGGCICILGFASSTWWSQSRSPLQTEAQYREELTARVTTAYGALMIYTILYCLFKVIRRKTARDWGFVKLEPNLVTLEETLNYMRHKVRPHAREYKGLWAALKEVWLDGFVLDTDGVTREADEHGLDEGSEPEDAH